MFHIRLPERYLCNAFFHLSTGPDDFHGFEKFQFENISVYWNLLLSVAASMCLRSNENRIDRINVGKKKSFIKSFNRNVICI